MMVAGAAVVVELFDGAPNPNADAAGLGCSDGVAGKAGADALSGFENPNENFGVAEAVDGVPAGVVEGALGGSVAGVTGFGWFAKENPEGVDAGVDVGLTPKLKPPGVEEGAAGVDGANGFDGAEVEVVAGELSA